MKPGARWLARWVPLLGLLLHTAGAAWGGDSVPVEGAMPAKTAAQFVHRRWDRDNGLPDNTVRAVARGADGFLYLGCNTGLARFDGVRFDIYDKRNVPGLANENVWALQADPSGGLWVGFLGGGLLHLDGRDMRLYTVDDGLSGNWVSALMRAADGTLWIGTDSPRLTLLRDGAFHYLDLPATSVGMVRRLYQDREGRVWVADTYGRLFVYHEGAFEVFGAEAWGGGEVNDVLQTDDGVWLATVTGLVRYDRGRFARHEDPALSGYEFTVLRRDTDGVLWAGSARGLVRLCRGGPDWLSTVDTLPIRVYAFFQDGEGSFWAGTYASGLLQLRDGAVTTYRIGAAGATDHVRCIYEALDGSMYVGSFDQGLTHYRDGRATRLTVADGLPSNQIWSVFEDARGDLWLATGQGLMRYAPLARREVLFHGTAVRFALEDHASTFWVGLLNGGLRYRRDGVFHPLTEAEGLVSNKVRGMWQQPDGRFQVITENGMSELRDNGAGGFVVRNYTTRDGLPHDWLVGGLPDGSGGLWLGTYGGGLAHFQDGRFTTFSKEDGLFGNNIWSLVDDGLGRLWMSCDLGLSAVARADLERVAAQRGDGVSHLHLGRHEGLTRLEFNGGGFPTGMRDRRGYLWFPSMGGAVRVDPRRVPLPSSTPRVWVTDMAADGMSRDTAEPVPAEARRDVTLRYTAVDFIQPHNLRFRYMLEGYDADWVVADTRREAIYTNIPPGTYRFRVQAFFPDSAGAPGEASLELSLLPRLYETTWFRLAAVLCALGLLLALHRARLFTLRARDAAFRKALEAEVARRTRELAQKNQELERLDNIVAAINREVALHDVADAIIEQGLGLFPGADAGAFFMHDGPDNLYRTLVAVGMTEAPRARTGYSAERIMHYLESARRVDDGIFILDDFQATWDGGAGGPPPRSILALYVPISEQPPGILTLINRDQPHAFGEADVPRLRRLRDHAVSAVNKAVVLQDLVNAQGELVEHAHLAGMAELAGEVLHHVGNAVNSIHVSAQSLSDILSHKDQWLRFFAKTLDLIREEAHLRADARMSLFVTAFERVYQALERNLDALNAESGMMRRNIHDVMDVLRDQQRHIGDAARIVEDLDLNLLLDEILHKRARFLRDKNILVVRSFGHIPRVRAERIKFSRVVYYLLKNAWEAIERGDPARGGRITLTTRETRDQVGLFLSDNGVGIPHQDHDQLFQYGYSTKGDGRGMGLHYCANAMREMAGSISIHSDGPARGTRVDLYLPRAASGGHLRAGAADAGSRREPA